MTTTGNESLSPFTPSPSGGQPNAKSMPDPIEVNPSAVEVFQVFRKSKYSAVLKVAVHGEPRVMGILGISDRAWIYTNVHPVSRPNPYPVRFSESRLAQMRCILHDIHKAGAFHGVTDPRNMMVCPGCHGKPDRVLWIDFDSAQLLPEYNLSPRQQMWLQEENELMDYFAESLVSLFIGIALASLTVLQPEDYREGKLRRTREYFFTRK